MEIREWRRGADRVLGAVLPIVLGMMTFGLIAVARAGDTPAAEAKTIFENRCAPCHGATGKGDGAGSANLTPKPRDFTDPAWQKSMSDEQIEQVIKLGGAAAGKSPMMPGNPDLMAKPEIVRALRDQVRGFGKAH
jgi:mono/diheme cytochrome c family protein